MSIQQEMLEIREYERALVEKGYPIEKRVDELNDYFDEWCFAKKPKFVKIIAYRIGDVFGKPIEV